MVGKGGSGHVQCPGSIDLAVSLIFVRAQDTHRLSTANQDGATAAAISEL